MLIVTGEIVARPDTFEEALALSLEHVERSRLEPGCLRHGAHVDAENPMRIFFFELWADAAALKAHFAVPASRDFSRAAARLAARTPSIQIYDGVEKTVAEAFA